MSTVDYLADHKDSTSNEIYDYWYELYFLLATLPLDSQEIRHSPEVLQRLRNAKWGADYKIVDDYWHRVDWTARHCRGNVLEIGSGMGNVTRWISANTEVTKVVSTDLQKRYIETLKSFDLPKVTALCVDILSNVAPIASNGPFDTVVLSELIEHLTYSEEIRLINAIRPLLAPTARWVITTPINYMEDPDHKRGFRRKFFAVRSKPLLGAIIASGDNSMQQFVACQNAPMLGSELWLRGNFVRLLDWAFHTRPSGQPWRTLSVIKKRLRLIVGR